MISKKFKQSLINVAMLIFAVVVLVLWCQWLLRDDNATVAPVGVHVIATPEKQVADIPKHQVAVKSGTVRVYESKAKIELKLPDAIKGDEAKQVIESTRMSSDDHDQTVTTILNTETGDTETLVRREPLPWMSWRDNGSAGIYAGIKNGQPTARLEVKQSIFSVKAVHIGAVATLDQPINSMPSKPEVFVGVGAEYRW